MAISPLAGKPAPKEILGDLARLERASNRASVLPSPPTGGPVMCASRFPSSFPTTPEATI
jgi:hypothetical protein